MTLPYFLKDVAPSFPYGPACPGRTPDRAPVNPANPRPLARGGRPQGGTRGWNAGLSVLRRQAYQCRDQQGTPWTSSARNGVPRSVPCRDHHIANASPTCAVLHIVELKKTQRGSSLSVFHMEYRLV